MPTVSPPAENTTAEQIPASLERRGRNTRNTYFPKSGRVVKTQSIGFGFEMSVKWAKGCDAGEY